MRFKIIFYLFCIGVLGCQQYTDVEPDVIFDTSVRKRPDFALSCNTGAKVVADGVSNTYVYNQQYVNSLGGGYYEIIWTPPSSIMGSIAFYQKGSVFSQDVPYKIIPYSDTISKIKSYEVMIRLINNGKLYLSDSGTFKSASKSNLKGFCNARFKKDSDKTYSVLSFTR